MRRQEETVPGQCDNSRIYTQCFRNVLEGVANGLWELSEEWSLDPGCKKEWLARERL